MTNEDKLFEACIAGDPRKVREQIRLGAKVNPIRPDGISPLHVAAQHGHMIIVRQLLERGAIVNEVTYESLTPEHKAASNGHSEIAELLSSTQGLHFACYTGDKKKVHNLLQQGAVPQATTLKGKNAFQLADRYGDKEIKDALMLQSNLLNACYEHNPVKVRELLDKGAPITGINHEGETLLHIAAKDREGTFVNVTRQLLERGANVNAISYEGETPLHIATKYKAPETIKLLLERGANVNATSYDGETPLHIATQYGTPDTIKLLLENGANINATTRDGRTPLHFAAYFGRVGKVRQLLTAKNVALNAITPEGWSPLHFAARTGRTEVVRLLLERGATITAARQDGDTPLHIAAESSNDAHIAVELLLKAGAATNAKTISFGDTALHLAASRGNTNILRLLVQRGADIHATTHDGSTLLHKAAIARNPEDLKLLLERGLAIDATTQDGHTPLYTAASLGNEVAVETLIHSGYVRHSDIEQCKAITNPSLNEEQIALIDNCYVSSIITQLQSALQKKFKTTTQFSGELIKDLDCALRMHLPDLAIFFHRTDKAFNKLLDLFTKPEDLVTKPDLQSTLSERISTIKLKLEQFTAIPEDEEIVSFTTQPRRPTRFAGQGGDSQVPSPAVALAVQQQPNTNTPASNDTELKNEEFLPWPDPPEYPPAKPFILHTTTSPTDNHRAPPQQRTHQISPPAVSAGQQQPCNLALGEIVCTNSGKITLLV